MNELLACRIVSLCIERHLIMPLNTMVNVLIYLVVSLHSARDGFKIVNRNVPSP